jgi:hypothetical protein
MNEKIRMNQARGRVISAFAGGGPKALWRIAGGEGPEAILARESIELATQPFHNLSLDQAVNVICGKS